MSIPIRGACPLLTLCLTSPKALAGDPLAGERGVPLNLTSLLAQDAQPAGGTAAAAPAQAAPAPAPEFKSYPPYPSLTHKFELKIGGALYGDFDTQVQVNSDAGLGANVDLEDLLGLDQSTNVLRVDMSYAFNPRHEVVANYYDITRSGLKTLPSDITIGGEVFQGGQSVHTDFDTTIIKLSYLYNFITDNRTKVGFSIGLYNMLIDAAFSTSTNSVQESFKGIAPMPVIGLRGKYAIGKSWNLLASAEVFQVDVDVVRGRLLDTVFAVENDLFDHVGWGLALNTFDMDISVDGDDGLGADLDYGYQGVLLYLRFFL